MINGLQPMTTSPATQPMGPNEQHLLKDSGKFSFKAKSFIIGEVIKFSKLSPGCDKVENKVLGFFAKPHDTPVPGNLQQMVPGLFRGAQPSAQGFQYLARIGVKTTINLSDETNFDAKWATAVGIKEIYQPQDGFAAPTDTQTRAFLKAATAPENQPVFFHCVHGSDRTGTMAACYRIAVNGWTAEQAIGELEPHKFNTPVEMAKLQYIHEFAAKWRGQAAAFVAAGP